jgi:signal transduction histidine kinase
VRDFLARNRVPARWMDVERDGEARELLLDDRPLRRLGHRAGGRARAGRAPAGGAGRRGAADCARHARRGGRRGGASLETTLAVLGHRLKHTDIELVRRYDKGLPKLIVRGSELNQVWTNLLHNAIDALGERGTITITTRPEAGGARVDVADDGPGIAPEIRERVFDSFFTTKDVGHGLGLATAHRIVVDRHHGTLTVDSEPGATSFHVWLPLTQS